MDLLTALGFGLGTAATLVPSPLIEFRYFVVPFVLMRLHLGGGVGRVGGPGVKGGGAEGGGKERSWRLATELGLYLVVHGVVLYLFLARSFEWEGRSGERMRFMW